MKFVVMVTSTYAAMEGGELLSLPRHRSAPIYHIAAESQLQ